MHNFHRRHLVVVLDDKLSNDYVLTEIQNLLTEINPFLTVESSIYCYIQFIFVITN